MKKTFLGAALLALAASPFAISNDEQVILDCVVSQMTDSTYYEESLSKEEYPHIELRRDSKGTLLFNIGGYREIGSTPGDLVEVRWGKTKGSHFVIGRRHDRPDLEVLHTWLKRSRNGKLYRTGVLTVYEEKDKPLEIARVYCKRSPQAAN